MRNGRPLHINPGPFTQADLPLDNGKTLHLQLEPEELAQNVILVGDPGRVTYIADNHLFKPEVDKEHRGLRTVTGVVKSNDQRVTLIRRPEPPQRLSLITSGMGTPSMEIVVNELYSLNEVNFDTRMRKKDIYPMNVIRVGTSGGIQKDVEINTPIISVYGISLDNMGAFLEQPYPDDYCKELEKVVETELDKYVSDDSRHKGRIHPIASKANPEVVEALEKTAEELEINVKKGITSTEPGFFAAQGRDILRVPIVIEDIDKVLAGVDTGNGYRIENLDMEVGGLLYILNPRSIYRSGAICIPVANRLEETFSTNYLESIDRTTRIALGALDKLQY